MNRLEYLTQLRRSLEDGGLAEDEINDAMGFYEEIFLDYRRVCTQIAYIV